MRLAARVVAVMLGVLAPYAAALASSTASDRISVGGSGSHYTVTGDSGSSEALAWLHNFDTDTLLAIGAEHQKLAAAHWSFGSLTGSMSRELGNGRYTFSAEAHEGAGDDGPKPFHYRIEAGGVTGTYFHQLSVQLEERRIDVETLHGNLPKIGISYLVTPHWLLSASRADSAGGNLGTQLTSARIDHYSRLVNLLAGASYGRASPIIINELGLVSPGDILREEYVGASRTFARRTDVTLTADYINLSGSKRLTLTLNFIIRLGSLGPRK
jgi:hypothetical protein